MAFSRTTIDLWTNQSPNGIKITATLEELGVPYNVHAINILENTQKEPWYTAMNPNGRLPTLSDTFTDGQKIFVWETAAIQAYLVQRYDPDHKISFPSGTRESHEVNSWISFVASGVGATQGQATHFHLYAPVKQEYAHFRYLTECKRLYGILDRHLANRGDYLVGNRCTIADLAHYGWIAGATWSGLSLDEFPALNAWYERMTARPAIQRARQKPSPWKFEEMAKDKKAADEFTHPVKEWFKQLIKEQMGE